MNVKKGSVYKRTDGRWVGQYQYENKSNHVYGKTKKEASDKLKTTVSTLNSPNYLPTTNNEIMLGGWLNEWLESYVKNIARITTYTDYENNIRHINEEIGDVLLKKINVKILQDFFNKKSSWRSF